MPRLIKKIIFFTLLIGASHQSLVPRPVAVLAAQPDVFLHFICWFVLSLAILLAFPQKNAYGLIAVLFVYSCLIEVGQHFVEGRFFSFSDMLCNGLGCVGVLVGQFAYMKMKKDKTVLVDD